MGKGKRPSHEVDHRRREEKRERGRGKGASTTEVARKALLIFLRKEEKKRGTNRNS